MLPPQFGKRFNANRRARSNCLKLVLKHLYPIKSIVETSHAKKSLIGEKKVTNIYYFNQRDNLHGDTTNVECLNARVYR